MLSDLMNKLEKKRKCESAEAREEKSELNSQNKIEKRKCKQRTAPHAFVNIDLRQRDKTWFAYGFLC